MTRTPAPGTTASETTDPATAAAESPTTAATTTPESAAPLIAAEHVSRRYGQILALSEASLTVHPGEIVGVLGPNGAGKSTLLSLISGERRPDSGTVRLSGGDPRLAATRTILGMTAQETGLPATLKVAEVVDFVARHYPDPLPTAELLERFGLTDLARRQTGALSGGQKRRLAVALAFAGQPRIVLLDEPTTGLDVSARYALWEAIRDYHGAGGTVLLTSHYLEEIQALAGRVVVINDGRILADDTLEAILRRVELRRVLVHSEADLADLPGVAHASTVELGARRGPRQELYTDSSDELIRALVTSGIPFNDLEVRGASLEEAIEQMLRSAADPATATAHSNGDRS